MKTPIALLGMPASGKSYWGKKLASHLDISFLDLDRIIEQEAGMSISEIFHEGGEHLFRSIETSALFRICQNEKSEQFVLAVGGGTPAYNNNIQILNACCTSIYLDVPISTLKNNLLSDHKNHRPLVKKTTEVELEQYLTNLKNEREVSYLQAAYQLRENEISIPNFIKIIDDSK